MKSRIMRSRIGRTLAGVTIAAAMLVGGQGVIAPQEASAAYVYDRGSYHYVPDWCYHPDWYVRWVYGYANSRTCVMNHLGYYGYYE